ncbi:MAG: hypothetical protein EOP55_16370 [Sphingobacteriales bacterium]|nr:MAG: hypothetical protein EOP55_16370 [Sphingobacteriales bacterium]
MKKFVKTIVIVAVLYANTTQCLALEKEKFEKKDFSYLKQNFSEFYKNDYTSFFDIFNEQSKKVESCKNKKTVIDFFSIAPLINGNVEVSEAFSESVESLATDNAKCFLIAWDSSPINVRKLLCDRLSRPIFKERKDIESSFKKINQTNFLENCLK